MFGMVPTVSYSDASFLVKIGWRAYFCRGKESFCEHSGEEMWKFCLRGEEGLISYHSFTLRGNTYQDVLPF